MRGRLVTIEGIDACGKTTIAKLVTTRLQARGFDAVFVNKKQTSGYASSYLTRFVEGLSQSLWNAQPDDPVSEIPEESWMFLHALWYRTMQDHLLDGLLNRHPYVVMDGWYYKFLARHRVHGERDPSFTRRVLHEIKPADAIFLLDAKPETCWERRASFRASELGAHHGSIVGAPEARFVRYQTEVRRIYLAMASEESWRKIDADQTAEEIEQQVVEDGGFQVGHGFFLEA